MNLCKRVRGGQKNPTVKPATKMLAFFIMERLNDNLEILKLMEKVLKDYPYLRFGQVVSHFILPYGKDIFYEEPQETLKRFKDNIEKINNP